jgi:hypothetical protein
MNSLFKTILWLSVFSIAMAFLETSVVVYLRKLYYPQGFHFPLAAIPPDIATIEFLREAATIVMLLGAAILAGHTGSQRFAFFVYAFAIWDLFYYVFLKLLLNWPESLSTWDILFLIPVPWIGPVIAPCLVSLTMIGLTLVIVLHGEMGYKTKIHFREWMLLSTGSLIIIWSFCTDYVHLVFAADGLFWTPGGAGKLFDEVRDYVPISFNWSMFGAGEMMLLIAIIVYVMRLRKKEQITLWNFKNKHSQLTKN